MKKNFVLAKPFDLQIFASGDNNGLPVRTYMPQFKELLTAVFGVQAYFEDFFAGGLEALDGVKSSSKAFSVKTSDIAVAVGTYDKTATKAFGTGTANSNRFGNRTEVIYTDIDVPYSDEWAFHEGIDRSTVNADFEEAIADRLDLQAQAVTERFNAQHGKFISDNAGKTITLDSATITADTIVKAFNELSKYFVNAKARGTKVAKVTPDVYNALVDSGLTTTSKNSTVNIDDNEVLKFKGFQIQEVPEEYFQENEVIYAYVINVAKAFTGINTTRTIESEDFDGVALQGHGKSGAYIPNDNKKAVAKVATPGGVIGSDVLTIPTQGQTLYGKRVSSLIGEDVQVLTDGSVLGTFKHVTGYTGFNSEVPAEQEGYFFPFKLTQTGTNMTFKKNGEPAKTDIPFEASNVFRVTKTDTFEVLVDGSSVVTFNFAKATFAE